MYAGEHANMAEISIVKPTRQPHYGAVTNRVSFQEAFELVEGNPMAEYYTKGNWTPFIIKAAITKRGNYKGQRVLIFLTNNQERARAYECCWGHITNCNRTYIDCYTVSIPKEKLDLTLINYDIFRHRHNFAVWAGARATQRGFTNAKTSKLRDSLQDSGLIEFVREHVSSEIDAATFAKLHEEWCNKIIKTLNDLGVIGVTFGRAAKLVAVYIKSMVVVGPYSQTSLARVAHPPIDDNILKNISRLENLPRDTKKIFRTTKWTSLSRDGYYDLIRMIQDSVPNLDPFWRLEEHWTVN
jgi:hypothetical protein